MKVVFSRRGKQYLTSAYSRTLPADARNVMPLMKKEIA